MDYINVELKKIRRSNLLLISIVLLTVFCGVYFLINNVTSPDINCFKFIYRSYSTIAYFPLLVPPILFTSLLFGKEFEDRTMIYTFIRPINYYKLFMNKIISAYLYSVLIALIFFVVTVGYGMIFFKISPFEFDSSILESSVRCLVLFLYTCVGILLVISICSIINMYSRKMFGSVMCTVILWLLFSVIVFKFNINGDMIRIPVTTYLNPAEYYDISMGIFLVKCICVTAINSILICIELFTSYKKSLKLRNS